jgi:hypothetical protein
MAFDKLVLKNPNTGEIIRAPVGFSWTALLFGPFVPLFRADWKYMLLMGGIFVLVIITSPIFLFLSFLALPVCALVFGAIYNKLYIRSLIFNRGFRVVNSEKGDLDRISNHLGLELPLI